MIPFSGLFRGRPGKKRDMGTLYAKGQARAMENSSRSLPVACKGRVFCRMRRGREAEEAGRGLARNIHAAAHETGTGAGQEGKTEEKASFPLPKSQDRLFFQKGVFGPPPRPGALPLSGRRLWSMIHGLKHCGIAAQASDGAL